MGSGGIAPLILNFGTRVRRVVSFTPQPLRKQPPYNKYKAECVGVVVTLLSRIWEVLRLNLGRCIGYPDCGVSSFSAVPPSKNPVYCFD
jgi:hypothetical protein